MPAEDDQKLTLPDPEAETHPAPVERAHKGTVPQRLWLCVKQGLVAAVKTAAWLLAIMVPVSLVVSLLHWTGLLRLGAQWLEPAFRLVGLPAETVVAFLTAVFLNIYSGIAALGSIALTDRQLTILALAMLISHNFPVEAIVQKKAGSSAGGMILLRLAASVVAAALLNWALPASDVRAATGGAAAAQRQEFWPMLGEWAIGIGWLAGKIVVLVTGLMILQKVLREFGWIRPLSWLLRPVLWLLGLGGESAFLWIVANTLGLAYGAAVIVEETRSGVVGREEALRLNRSVAVCHSLLEDTLLFVVIGAWAFWLTIPRLALAAAVVWAGRLWVKLARAPKAVKAA